MSSTGQQESAMRLVLLGPSGAGKGTQARMLAESLGIRHIASGELFRYHQREGSALGLKAMEYMSKGLLVPDQIATEMVLEQVVSPSSQSGYLLDGFPRNLGQARALDEALDTKGQEINRAILLKVPREELVKRLSGRLVCGQCQAPYHRETAPPKTPGRCDLCDGELYQRQDDRPEAVRVRIEVYEAETQPLTDYYGHAGKLMEVDGVGTVEHVRERLLRSFQD